MTQPDLPRPRVTSKDASRARQALADTVERFADWNAEIASLSAEASRGMGEDRRCDALEVCARLKREMGEAHMELIGKLADAPPGVAGHSRVVDVARALDRLGDLVRDLTTRLS